jgi:hypothetical protein
VADHGGMLQELCQQLTLAILDDWADAGLRMIKTIRSYLDAWEAFWRTGRSWSTICVAHHADRACAAADLASLDRRHWAHGSDLASFLAAYPIQV